MLYYADKPILDSDNFDECKKIEDHSNSITVIGFYEVIVKKIVAEKHVHIISPNVIFDNQSIVNLSSTVTPPDRLYKEGMKRRGLPGLPGTSGYNLTITSFRCNSENINFVSKGTKGGKGQNGEPSGLDGKDGVLTVRSQDVDIGIYKQIAYIGINNKKNSSELMSLFHL